MNNFRFNHFVPWEKFSLFETQDSKPLDFQSPITTHHIEALFGKDFLDYLTHFEKDFLHGIYETVGQKVLRPQLSTSSGALTDIYFYIMVPENKLLNFQATAWLGLEDFPFFGSSEHGLKLNFSLNARSAILFSIFAQSKTHMDGCFADIDFEDCPVLLAFRINAAKLCRMFTNGEATLWNRKYLDYFVSLEKGIELSQEELKTLHTYRFSPAYTFGRLVELSNDELDRWNTPFAQKTFHWRHYHLAICDKEVISSLLDLTSQDDQPEDFLGGITRTLSSLSLGSFQLVETLTDGNPEKEEEDTFDDVDIFTNAQPLFYHTTFGSKFHTFPDCKGLNSRPYTATLECHIPQGRTLCFLCKARTETLLSAGITFGRNSSGSVVSLSSSSNN